MTTVLLTLGRLPLALDLARGFSRAGCRVLVADPFGRTLAGASHHVARSWAVPPPATNSAGFLAAIAGIVAREAVDIVVPVSEETMHVAFLRDLIDARVRVLAMPPDQVIALHDKAGFVRAGLAHGLSVPASHPLGTPQAHALAAAGAVVVKPVFSCAGRGVRIMPAGCTLPDCDTAAPAIVQRFIAGHEFSSCSLAHEGRVLATMVYRGTAMSGSVAIAFERVEHPGIADWIARFVAAHGWSGFIAFDFIVDAAGLVWGIECNPRVTSGLHFWEPGDVARAVLNPTGHAPVRVRRQRQLQQFYACLTETQLAMLRGRGWRDRLARLLTTRDVTWDWRDPWPFLSMIVTAWPIIRMAMAQRVPFGEVATRDVGWYDHNATPDVAAIAGNTLRS
ncbi:ATP-grasp domain-containing protein [Novosphingobium sp.]|uniref:ATP-grasp domain-containing protein n=1 Tax=Novosphingobium sp. TaxID=1874826 RepID=UPI0033429D25